MGTSWMLESGSACGMSLVPPSQPTHAPRWVDITGRSAVTRPPGESSQPLSPCWTGSLFATATTGMSRVSGRFALCVLVIAVTVS